VGEYQSPEYAAGVGLVMFGAEQILPEGKRRGVKDRTETKLLSSLKQWFRNFLNNFFVKWGGT
jgi:hypothetical protein